MATHLRIARPVGDLARSVAMYRNGIALDELGRFTDHAGFDGVMLGEPGAGYHLEFTVCRQHPVQPRPTPEDMLVFYVADAVAWQQRCSALLAAGFLEVAPFNPYWAQQGRTFADTDGYRVVVQRAAWLGGPASAP
jgi:hypothetical protein